MAEVSGGSFNFTRIASGDLSGAQFRFVQPSGRDVFLANSGATYAYVLQNKPANNENANITAGGFTKVVVAASLGPQTEIAVGSGGYAILAFQAGPVSSGTIQGHLVTGATSGGTAEAFLSRR